MSWSTQAQNEQLIAVVETGRLGLELERGDIAAGKPAALRFRVRRGKEIAGPVKVSLAVPAHVKGVACLPVTLKAGESSGTLRIGPGPRRGAVHDAARRAGRAGRDDGRSAAERGRDASRRIGRPRLSIRSRRADPFLPQTRPAGRGLRPRPAQRASPVRRGRAPGRRDRSSRMPLPARSRRARASDRIPGPARTVLAPNPGRRRTGAAARPRRMAQDGPAAAPATPAPCAALPACVPAPRDGPPASAAPPRDRGLGPGTADRGPRRPWRRPGRRAQRPR